MLACPLAPGLLAVEMLGDSYVEQCSLCSARTKKESQVYSDCASDTRPREIGIRIAIGASGDSVLLLIFRHGLMMTVSGVVLGLGISLLLKPLVASQLVGSQVFDGPTFSLASVLLVTTALVPSSYRRIERCA